MVLAGRTSLAMKIVGNLTIQLIEMSRTGAIRTASVGRIPQLRRCVLTADMEATFPECRQCSEAVRRQWAQLRAASSQLLFLARVPLHSKPRVTLFLDQCSLAVLVISGVWHTPRPFTSILCLPHIV